MSIATNLGFPRIGAKRELKFAVEAFWAGKQTADELITVAKTIRQTNWETQKKAGISHIPSNDFSYYDQILDMALTLGAIPARYRHLVPAQGRDAASLFPVEFAMARGLQDGTNDLKAQTMRKFFDTNYHYIIPEFEADHAYQITATKIFDEYVEAKNLGIATRPVIMGPVSFALLGKANDASQTPEVVVRSILPVYVEIIKKLAELGAEWIQIDEPFLAAVSLTAEQKALYELAYNQTLAPVYNGLIKVLVATYYESLSDNTSFVSSLNIDAIHVDLCRTSGRANTVANNSHKDVELLTSLIADSKKVISLGLVDGRNIWKNNLTESLSIAQVAVDRLGKDRVFIAPSTSLLHSPVDLESETKLAPEFKAWLAFATQKLTELSTLSRAINNIDDVKAELAASDAVAHDRKTNPKVHNAQVKERLRTITPEQYNRKNPFTVREKAQADVLNLPLFPTTTIGSFPQTGDIRSARAQLRQGKIDNAQYTQLMEDEIKKVIEFQEKIELDVLVHGEPERNDMVEYFGEQLEGFFFTTFAWVASYGSRCVKPPIIFGDVSRSAPMTVKWSKYAQSLTSKPVKGMLTGPVTILQWSFVRDDQPRSETALQIALAIRDEVADLETAGIKVIQIDEAALREGLPLREADHDEYLTWAVDSFRLSSACVDDITQIHTHLCYSDFNAIIAHIARMDTDSISIETSRSQSQLFAALSRFAYPNHIGPGVYDIHSPRVPSKEEIKDLLTKSLQYIKKTSLWVNPDCGLKTRQWAEVEPSLIALVQAAKELRVEHQ